MNQKLHARSLYHSAVIFTTGLNEKPFKKPCLKLVRVASSDVGMCPKSGGLGNIVELKVKFRDCSLYYAVILFGSFLVAKACRHPYLYINKKFLVLPV